MKFLRRCVVLCLTWEARAVLSRYKPKVIAVTGSVGKTTTKDAIYAALSESLSVRKNQKSLNSEIGVPLTILGLENAWNSPILWAWNLVLGLWRIIVRQNYPAWLILEVGADRPGDIRSVARWLRPDVAVLTGVPEIPVHVEFFNSPEEVFKEKRALAEYLKAGGKLVLNGDDERMRRLQQEFRGASVLYGTEDGTDFRATHIDIARQEGRPEGVRFRAEHDGSSVPVALFGALGVPRVYAALAAIAVADCVGVDAVTASTGLRGWEAPPGRVRIIEGIKGAIIIDDTYNSSPAAALAALDTLRDAGLGRRKIAILGDMMELGRYSKEAHRTVGERAAQCADLLITVGFRSRATAEAALDAGMKDLQVRSYELNESARAGKELEAELKEGDVVLVKGSQSMRMERAVLEIMAHPEKAADLLVRMDPEWMTR
ncbi:MAG TPA: UDP-N-acetylmuramoyl-tripeptide--D-alanyl-D-alanine ligase [Candidatus Paceibacterota bacterium]|nr:UDP-N-acetylmuramoyl-tripeptide--D-alanyl-D-alanine ligase [Candidatus Paceibacterota bacterium]